MSIEIDSDKIDTSNYVNSSAIEILQNMLISVYPSEKEKGVAAPIVKRLTNENTLTEYKRISKRIHDMFRKLGIFYTADISHCILPHKALVHLTFIANNDINDALLRLRDDISIRVFTQEYKGRKRRSLLALIARILIPVIKEKDNNNSSSSSGVTEGENLISHLILDMAYKDTNALYDVIEAITMKLRQYVNQDPNTIKLKSLQVIEYL